MDHNQVACLSILGVAAVMVLYVAQQNSDSPIPQTQGEGQVMGMGVQAGMRVNANTPVDLRHEVHFWIPGYDPDPTATPTVKTRHRYPALPGGNISTIIHKGFSAFSQDSPVDNDWRITPPEAAVIL